MIYELVEEQLITIIKHIDLQIHKTYLKMWHVKAIRNRSVIFRLFIKQHV